MIEKLLLILYIIIGLLMLVKIIADLIYTFKIKKDIKIEIEELLKESEDK